MPSPSTARALVLVLVTACGGREAEIAEPNDPARPTEAAPTGAAATEAAPRASQTTAATIEPPAGWRLERREATLFASASTTPAAMALTTLPLASTSTQIEEAVEQLAEALGATAREGIRTRGLAEQRQSFGGRSLALWEVPYVERDGVMGALVVFAGKLDAERLVVGLGYAPVDDAESTEAIMTALSTIAPSGLP